jgi:hypothetical protein
MYNTMKKLLSIITLVALSLGVYAQHDHNAHASHSKEKGTPAFKDEKVGAAYMHYLHLKDALVASNGDESKKAAGQLEKALASVSNGKKAQDAAKAIASSSDINEQRKTFSSLSNEMTTLVKTSKLASGSLYVEYCPMANNNEGAFWLSNEKEIKNPYFGDMMLKCGSVKETLQ